MGLAVPDGLLARWCAGVDLAVRRHQLRGLRPVWRGHLQLPGMSSSPTISLCWRAWPGLLRVRDPLSRDARCSPVASGRRSIDCHCARRARPILPGRIQSMSENSEFDRRQESGSHVTPSKLRGTRRRRRAPPKASMSRATTARRAWPARIRPRPPKANTPPATTARPAWPARPPSATRRATTPRATTATPAPSASRPPSPQEDDYPRATTERQAPPASRAPAEPPRRTGDYGRQARSPARQAPADSSAQTRPR